MLSEVLNSLATVSTTKKNELEEPRMKEILRLLDEWDKSKDQHESHYKALMKEIDALKSFLILNKKELIIALMYK